MADIDKHGHRVVDLHDDDTTARRTLLSDLFSLRGNISRADVADYMGIMPRAVWGFENKPSGNRKLDVAQRYARAINHRVVLTPVDLPGPHPADVVLLDILAGLAEQDDPQRADTAYIAYVIAQLASARRAARLSRAALAAVIGCAECSMEAFEGDRVSPFISTVQRQARAIGIAAGTGGWLRLHIETATDQAVAEAA